MEGLTATSTYGSSSSAKFGAQTIRDTAPPTELASIIARLDEICDNLAGNCGALRVTADRVVGSRGEDAGKTAPTPVPNGALSTLNQSLDRLAALVMENRSQIDRLGNI